MPETAQAFEPHQNPSCFFHAVPGKLEAEHRLAQATFLIHKKMMMAQSCTWRLKVAGPDGQGCLRECAEKSLQTFPVVK